MLDAVPRRGKLAALRSDSVDPPQILEPLPPGPPPAVVGTPVAVIDAMEAGGSLALMRSIVRLGTGSKAISAAELEANESLWSPAISMGLTGLAGGMAVGALVASCYSLRVLGLSRGSLLASVEGQLLGMLSLAAALRTGPTQTVNVGDLGDLPVLGMELDAVAIYAASGGSRLLRLVPAVGEARNVSGVLEACQGRLDPLALQEGTLLWHFLTDDPSPTQAQSAVDDPRQEGELLTLACSCTHFQGCDPLMCCLTRRRLVEQQS